MGWPRSLAPTVAPTVAMATTITVAWRKPARMSGMASGNWMRRSRCPWDMPMPVAASITAGSTLRRPTTVLRTIGNCA